MHPPFPDKGALPGQAPPPSSMFFSTGSLCPGLQRAIQPCSDHDVLLPATSWPHRCFSPRGCCVRGSNALFSHATGHNVLLPATSWPGKGKGKRWTDPICNQPICLSGANGSPCLAASDVTLLPFVIFLCLCTFTDASSFFFPFPFPPCNETVYAVHDCHGRGGVSNFCSYFKFGFCSSVCLSRCFLRFCCFPAACLCFSGFLPSRGARPSSFSRF